MNVILHAKGIFCESGDDGLANILGTLAIEQPFNSAMYSTLDGLASGFDTRPITLAVGDSLVYFANLPITLGFDDIIQIDGNILGFSTLTITHDELVDINGPQAFELNFTEGNQSVTARFEVEKSA